MAGLMYRDLAGHPRPRRYVLAAMVIFALVGGIALLGWQQQRQFRAEAVSIPPVSKAAFHVTPLLEIHQQTTLPAINTSPTQIPNPCPPEPALWQFEKIPGSNLERIIPECVYADLARAVAWDLMAESMGYAGTEAAGMLGFSNLPFEPQARVVLPTEKDSYEIGLHLNFAYFEGRSWILTADVQPALTYFLQGCFRADGYPVICSLGRDNEKAGIYMDAQGYRFGRLQPPEEATQYQTREFALFGYRESGRWVFLGIQDQPQAPLSELGEAPQDWRARQAGLHGVEVWDAGWVEQTFGYSMRPLPVDWQVYSDPQDAQTIARITNDYLQPLWEKGVVHP
jgi:hypothetical protein